MSEAEAPGVARYRNREPVIVDAIRWTGENEDAVTAFVGEVNASSDSAGLKTWDEPGFVVIRSTVDENFTGRLWNSAHGCWVSVLTGWYVVKGITGHFFTLTGEQFTDIYEPQSLPAPDDTGRDLPSGPEPFRSPAAAVTDEAVQAALAAAIAWQAQPPRQPLWQAPATEQVRVMLERAAPLIVAAYEQANAESWNTSCVSCARLLDSAYKETERAERAEAKLAAIKEYFSVLSSRDAWYVLAITGGDQTQERSDGKESP